MANVQVLPRVKSTGSLSLLDEPLTALFWSNRCPGDLILKAYGLGRAMRHAGVLVISGFQRPIERCFKKSGRCRPSTTPSILNLSQRRSTDEVRAIPPDRGPGRLGAEIYGDEGG